VYDMLSVCLLLSLPKTIGACLTFKKYENIKLYRDLRYVYLIILLLCTIGFSCFFGVRILSVKKEIRGPFVQ
jgi:hypothetical protein